MELRIQKLEEFAETAKEEFRAIDVRLARLEIRVDELKASVKADLADMNSELIKWIVGTMLAGGAVAISVMTFVLHTRWRSLHRQSPSKRPFIFLCLRCNRRQPDSPENKSVTFAQ